MSTLLSHVAEEQRKEKWSVSLGFEGSGLLVDGRDTFMSDFILF
jgi:hypothetical protein